MNLPWPKELDLHPATRPVTVGDLLDISALRGHGARVIAGLRVRMGVNTGEERLAPQNLWTVGAAGSHSAASYVPHPRHHRHWRASHLGNPCVHVMCCALCMQAFRTTSSCMT